MIDLQGLNGSKFLNALLLLYISLTDKFSSANLPRFHMNIILRPKKECQAWILLKCQYFKAIFRCQRCSITYPAMNKFCGWEKEDHPPYISIKVIILPQWGS